MMMNYKGYHADFGYSDDDDCFVGHIAGISDVVGFHAESMSGTARRIQGSG